MGKYIITVAVFICAFYLSISNYENAQIINISSMAADVAIGQVETNDLINEEYLTGLDNETKDILLKMFKDKIMRKEAYISGKNKDRGKHFILISVTAYDIESAINNAKLELNSKYKMLVTNINGHEEDYNKFVRKNLSNLTKKSWSLLLEVEIKKPELVFGRFTNNWSLIDAKVKDISKLQNVYSCNLNIRRVKIEVNPFK